MPKEEVNQHGGLRKEEDEELEIDLDDSKFAEKHSESATRVIQRLLCNQKASNTTKRRQIFYSRCSVKSNVCTLIIVNESYENIISRALDYLKLETEPHSQSYTIGWIKKGLSIKVTDLCHVLISIDKFYQDFIACDIVNMGRCHILLRRPWQHDIDATHRGKRNIYVFT